VSNDRTTWPWPFGAHSDLSLVVVAPNQQAAHQAVGLLERAGLDITIELIVTGRVTFDGLTRPPDIVLIDCGIGPAGAMEAVERARREVLGARIVVIFSEGENDPHKIFRAGAAGLVERSAAAGTLPAAVQAVAVGQLSVPLALHDLVEPPALTHREKQVLGLMAEGLTNAAIGRRLYLAESTVKTHVSNAFKRLGVRSRYEASARLLAADPALRQDLLAVLESTRTAGHSGIAPRLEPVASGDGSVTHPPARTSSAAGKS
jgi:DNA-binding NarL/FixJ family response regulator